MPKHAQTTKVATSKAQSKAPEPKVLTKPHTFTITAPQAKKAIVAGSFNGWRTDLHSMTKTGAIWELTVSLPMGRHEYRFLVDGIWCDDPCCSERVPNPFGSQNAVLTI